MDPLKRLEKDKYFFCENGAIIRSLAEADEAIENMTEASFRNHVNDQKNDFANWVRGVYLDDELADELMSTKDKNRTQLLFVRRALLSFLEE